jgi:hypothetical protein
MNTNEILADLRAERDRIGQAIVALEALDATGTHAVRRGRLPKSTATPATTGQPAPTQRRGGRRRISAAGRKRIAEAARKMWAERRKKAAPSKRATAAKKATPARHMSAATRKHLSEIAKKRWAKRKREGKTRL